MSLLLRNLAHSSAVLLDDVLGFKVMVAVLPPTPASNSLDVLEAEALSPAGPLLMKMIKLF